MAGRSSRIQIRAHGGEIPVALSRLGSRLTKDWGFAQRVLVLLSLDLLFFCAKCQEENEQEETEVTERVGREDARACTLVLHA